MQVWLRLLIVWFVALALPLQGMAAVTMAHCGQSHERMQKAQPETSHHGSAGHDGVSAKVKAAADPIETAKYKCSSCASCCAGAALPSLIPRIPVIPQSPVFSTDEQVAVDAFASDGPDRPPRTSRV